MLQLTCQIGIHYPSNRFCELSLSHLALLWKALLQPIKLTADYEHSLLAHFLLLLSTYFGGNMKLFASSSVLSSHSWIFARCSKKFSPINMFGIILCHTWYADRTSRTTKNGANSRFFYWPISILFLDECVAFPDQILKWRQGHWDEKGAANKCA